MKPNKASVRTIEKLATKYSPGPIDQSAFIKGALAGFRIGIKQYVKLTRPK